MPSAKTAAVKVTFGNETRRVGSDFFLDDEWEAFCQSVRKLLENDFVGIEDGSIYAVTYTDSDGDTVTVRSTAELQESFKAQGEVARFLITEQQAPRPHRFGGGCRRGPGAWWRRNAEAGGVGPFWLAKVGGLTSAPPRPLPRWAVWGQGREARIAAQLNAEAVQLMEQNKLDEAATLLQTGLQRHPNANQLWYNLACVEALRGERPGALAALRACVQSGYKDAEHVLADDDLICLHSNPEFAEIVECMRNGDTTRYVDNHEAYLNSSLLSFRKEGAIEDAWKVVQQGVELGIKTPQFLYNSACVASLLLREEEAAAFLVEAVGAGFDNKTLIESDDDLAGIRAHAGYFAAVNILARKSRGVEEEICVLPESTVVAPFEREEVQDHTEVAVSPSPSVTSSADSVNVWVELDEVKAEHVEVEMRAPSPLPPPPTPIVVAGLAPIPTAVASVPAFQFPIRTVPSAPPAPPVAEPLPTPRTEALMNMGFERDISKAALIANNGDVERAVNALLA